MNRDYLVRTTGICYDAFVIETGSGAVPESRLLARKDPSMTDYSPVKEGKVREIYDLGEHLLMYATDRISAFDAKIVTLPSSPRVAAASTNGTFSKSLQS